MLYGENRAPLLYGHGTVAPPWHNRDLELFSTLSMAREFISDYAVTISRDRIVVPELAEKSAFFSHVRNELFKN